MTRLAFALYATLITWMPVAAVAIQQGWDTPFWFLAGDAYLYLGIAQASDGIGMSYDGIRATNGFHPVWQTLVRLATEALGSPLAAMWASAMGAAFFAWVGVLALGGAIRKLTGSWVLAMLAVPGVYYLVIGQALGNLSVWAFFDGMEAGLAFALFGLSARMIAHMPRDAVPLGWWLRLGLLLGALTLTRLDEVFVPLSMALAVVFWGHQTRAAGIKAGALLLAPTAVGVGLFALWGLMTAGMLAPVSGAAKGEGALLANAWVTMATFFAPVIDLREGLTSYVADREGLLGGAFRVVQLIVPTAFALGFLVALWRRYRAEPWAPLLAGFCGGVLIKGSYGLLSVNYSHQASWYYAVAMGLMTLGTAILLAPAMRRLSPRGAALAAGVIAVMGSLHASLWAGVKVTDPLPAQQRDFWNAAPALQAQLLAIDPAMRIVEFGDGTINFTLDMPVRHGFVFAGDRQSLEALRNESLLRDAHDDGFTVISSYEYLRVPEGAEDWTPDQVAAFLRNSFLDPRVKAELDDFTFEMIAVSRPRGIPFIRMTPR